MRFDFSRIGGKVMEERLEVNRHAAEHTVLFDVSLEDLSNECAIVLWID